MASVGTPGLQPLGRGGGVPGILQTLSVLPSRACGEPDSNTQVSESGVCCLSHCLEARVLREKRFGDVLQTRLCRQVRPESRGQSDPRDCGVRAVNDSRLALAGTKGCPAQRSALSLGVAGQESPARRWGTSLSEQPVA